MKFSPGIDTIRLLVGFTPDCLNTGVHTLWGEIFKIPGCNRYCTSGRYVLLSVRPSVHPFVCQLQKISYSSEISKIYLSYKIG